ncbi:hypothetical protein PO124_02785 [Bacillus licheniformis]|nr:hypothetical protein [Bacillus licheniformis]
MDWYDPVLLSVSLAVGCIKAEDQSDDEKMMKRFSLPNTSFTVI